MGEAGLIQLKLDLAKAEIQSGTFAQSLRLSAELSNQVVQNISSFAAAQVNKKKSKPAAKAARKDKSSCARGP